VTRIQLLADSAYTNVFSAYLDKFEGIELVSNDRFGTTDLILDTMFLDPESKLIELSKLTTNASIVISNTLTASATSIQHSVGPKHNVIGMPIFPHYFERQKTVEYALPLGADHADNKVVDFLTLLGKTGERINDAIAGIFPRTLAMIVNEAAFAVQESVALPEDIDVAMKLGTNYPMGPLAWCDEIGAPAIIAVLDALAKEYGPERYRAASILRRYAEAGIPFIPKKVDASIATS
jgi:3-hydroxybutyryl-CoA dehydrogenase